MPEMCCSLVESINLFSNSKLCDVQHPRRALVSRRIPSIPLEGEVTDAWELHYGPAPVL